MAHIENELLQSENVEKMITLVEEAARSSELGVKRFIEPAHGTLRRAVSKRHHLIFGRRGSGKSSLLRKAAADLTIDRRPIAYVDMEAFKAHSYPDVLISVLIKTFSEFEAWLKTAAVFPATKISFWGRLFNSVPGRGTYKRRDVHALADRLHQQIATVHASLAGGLSTETVQEFKEQAKRSKTTFLNRHIMEYQKIFKDMGSVCEGDSYLFWTTCTTYEKPISRRD